MKHLRASPKAAAVCKEPFKCVRNLRVLWRPQFDGISSQYDPQESFLAKSAVVHIIKYLGLAFICKMGTWSLFSWRCQIGFRVQIRYKSSWLRRGSGRIKLGWRTGSGVKIASSFEILLFLDRNPKSFNWLVDRSHRPGQVTSVGNEESKDLMEAQLSRISLNSWIEFRFSGYGKGLNLLIILHWLRVLYPTGSGCRAKSVRLRSAYLRSIDSYLYHLILSFLFSS